MSVQNKKTMTVQNKKTMVTDLTPEKVAFYAKEILKDSEMDSIRQMLMRRRNKVPAEWLKKYIDRADEFTYLQRVNIWWGFSKGLSPKEVELFAKPEFSPEQMFIINHALTNNLGPGRKITYDQAKVFAVPSCPFETMRMCYHLFLEGMPKEQVKFFVNKDYNEKQVYQILKGYRDGLTFEQIKIYADERFTPGQMDELRLAFMDGLTIDQVKTFAKRSFGVGKMEQLRLKKIKKSN